MKEPEPGPLEKLNTKLHRWENEVPPPRRSSLSALEGDLPYSWEKPEKKAWGLSNLPWLNVALLLAVVFFLIMAGVFAWFFFRNDGRVSIGNITLEVEGPKTVKAGEEAILNLTLANGNSVPLEFVDLILEYPLGARSADGEQTELTRQRFQFGTIASGETRKQSVKFILFGEENTPQNIKVSTEYRLKDSNAIFDKTTNYSLEITDAPVTLTLAAPDEINSGQDLNLDVEIVGDAKTAIEDPTLLMHYPSGFEFKRASPSPVSGNNARWDLETLKPGEKRHISIIGTINIQDDEERAFRGQIGTKYQVDENKLSILYDSDLKTIQIKRSYIALSARINGESASEVYGNSKEEFRVNLEWNNTLPEPIKDGTVSVVIEGEGVNRNSINVAQGFYRSSDSSVNWNGVSVPKLASISPGDSGTVEFAFSSASLVSGSGALRNPEINLRVKFKGTRVLEGGEGETQAVEAEITRKIKLNSVVELVARALHRTGPIPNTGPLPPKVGERTTYTITWTLANSSNNLEEARVQATLPLYMEWVGNVTPSSEPLEFVAAQGGGGEVIWKAGSVRAETGSRLPQREVSFQVALKPSLGQVEQTPTLLKPASFSAVDSFTHQKLTGEMKRSLDTYLVTEAGFKVGEDKVVE